MVGIHSSFQFSLSCEPQNKNNVADSVVWTQFKTEAALASDSDISLNRKSIY